MSNIKNKSLIIKFFEQFLEDKISAEELVNKWPNEKSKLDPLEEDILHELDHYIADQDIHYKDVEYKKIQLDRIKDAYNIIL